MMVEIVPMTMEDAEGKAYVHWKSWHETYTGLIDQEYMNKTTLEKCIDIAKRWPDGLLVAKVDGRVVGFAGYGAYRDATLKDTGEVFSIYVLQEAQGKKIGYALMKAACERLQDYSQVALWVLKGNEKAIRFYERFGYRFDGMEQPTMLGTERTELRMIYKQKEA